MTNRANRAKDWKNYEGNSYIIQTNQHNRVEEWTFRIDHDQLNENKSLSAVT